MLGELLDLILNPAMGIKNWDTIDWLKWLMAAGRTPDEFFSTGKLTFTIVLYGTVQDKEKIGGGERQEGK